jgi:hypothetical protein
MAYHKFNVVNASICIQILINIRGTPHTIKWHTPYHQVAHPIPPSGTLHTIKWHTQYHHALL